MTKQDIVKKVGLAVGLSALLLPFVLQLEGLSFAGHLTLGIFIMAGVFWMTEPIPIFATSLLVILLQILLLSDKGIITFPEGSGYTAQNYKDFYATLSSPVIILFLGGFSLAAAAVKYGLDQNLTRWLVKPFGSKPQNVCLGLMLATALLSAFMSNTATTAMMMTVVAPIVAGLSKADPFRKAIALCIPVAANIGGIATPIGTPPNAIALSALKEQGIHIAFSTWMMLAVPLVAVMLFVGWRVLLMLFPPSTDSFAIEFREKSKFSKNTLLAYGVFGLTVILWVTEKLHGVSSTVIAFIPVTLLPALGILEKKDIRGFSWEVLWLVAGGISMGISLKSTGLAAWLIQLVDWSSLGGVSMVILFALVAFAIANLVSHTVTATLIVPLAIGLALTGVGGDAVQIGPWIALLGIIVSFSMMLPISTPPNAIAMSTGLIATQDMTKAAIWIGIVGIIFSLLCCFFFWPFVF